MKNRSGTISLLIMGFILILGFQNCDGSSFRNEDLIQEAPFNSINIGFVGSTQYKGGFSFSYRSKTDAQIISEFKVRKINTTVYLVQEGSTLITCRLGTPNSMEELMQITEIAKVTHPTFLSDFEVCEPADGKFIHYKVGDTSPIYLIASSQNENCLLDDPQRFLDENKRIFIIDNLSFEEIETLVVESKALATSASCTVNDLSLE